MYVLYVLVELSYCMQLQYYCVLHSASFGQLRRLLRLSLSTWASCIQRAASLSRIYYSMALLSRTTLTLLDFFALFNFFDDLNA